MPPLLKSVDYLTDYTFIRHTPPESAIVRMIPVVTQHKICVRWHGGAKIPSSTSLIIIYCVHNITYFFLINYAFFILIQIFFRCQKPIFLYRKHILAIELKFCNRISDILHRKMLRAFLKAFGYFWFPAFYQLFYRADIKIAIVKILF